ncbi:uncharacterized protein FIBRA_03463 [Fibroporia radiculosa]|uniref:DUF6697 domain-containing protein n=1 Tax=Fibroporia radiculosa TaxID=599839 RepID=J4HW03_9APHY|nr:uncharacterized protein FIBRA_03463 [Fibroporia radiculosa]CCM01412.1 predicted protein [Fibroporia radiculosa]
MSADIATIIATLVPSQASVPSEKASQDPEAVTVSTYDLNEVPILNSSSTQNLTAIVLRNETVWDNFPQSGFAIKPTRTRTKKGKWQDSSNKKLRRSYNDLVVRLSDRWYYIGGYSHISTELLDKESFMTLPAQVREAVIRASGHQKYWAELHKMYESGELTAVRIRFKRVKFNKELGKLLLDTAQSHGDNLVLRVGLSDAAVAQNEGAPEESDDDSD